MLFDDSNELYFDLTFKLKFQPMDNEKEQSQKMNSTTLLFLALFFAIVMLRYEATQALQREMLLPIAIGISMTKATILNAPLPNYLKSNKYLIFRTHQSPGSCPERAVYINI